LAGPGQDDAGLVESGEGVLDGSVDDTVKLWGAATGKGA